MLLLLGLALAQDNPDLVTNITVEGYDRPWYSGYLDLPQGKNFHYVYFPSQSAKKSDPLLVWLNGGPGCSSMIGMLFENGPFLFRPGQK
jgi:carboxypeptidase C (cathepsin A)